MLVSATRRFSALTLRALFYLVLFLFVALAQVAVTTAFRAIGWPAGVALAASGAIVLILVLGGVQLGEKFAERRAVLRESQRLREGLPSGPCCVVWRSGEHESAMPWELAAPMRASYPRLARQLAIEGVAIVDFEIGAGGAPKNIHCVDVWPSSVFYAAARDALTSARFQPRLDAYPRFGASYRMPFIFRIAGAAQLKDRGAPARQDLPVLRVAFEAVEKLRRTA
ncbi:MAG: TonB family protein [Pseudomonadota bacterium]